MYRRLPLIVILLAVCLKASALYYTTTFKFNANQAPLYEGGNWDNGKTSLNWSNVQTYVGFATGDRGNNFQDSAALLVGSWGPDQDVSATVFIDPSLDLTNFAECEILLRGTKTGTTFKTYECTWSPDGLEQCFITRWNGATGDADNLALLGVHAIHNGDVLRATIVGQTITMYINGVSIGTYTDNSAKKITSGNPGMGFDSNIQSFDYTKMGYTSYTASDGITEANVNHAAASAGLHDVQAALNWCINTDTNTIPAGTPVGGWTNTLVITQAITLAGAGVGSTIISNNQDPSTPLIRWTLWPATTNSRITGIEFRRGTNGSHFWQSTEINGLDTDGRSMRIDHCQYTSLEGGAILPIATLGVFDHNTVITEGTPAWLGYIKGNGWGGEAFGDGAYTNKELWGSYQFFFIEDNLLTNRAGAHITMLDSQAGAKYVFRHNKVYKGSMESHGLEAQRERSGRAREIYINTFDGIDTQDFITYMRGGCDLIWSNYVFGYTATPTMDMPYNRIVDAIAQPFGGADGRNPWDTNNASNPFDSGTCSSASALHMTDSGKSWSTDQWKGYILRKTSGKTVSSITRSGSTVTVNCTAHGFTNNQYISVFQQPQSVNSEQPYVGTWQITSNNANAFSYSVGNAVTPATPATATYKACISNYFSQITGNNNNTLTFSPSIYDRGAGLTMTFASGGGETYEINKLERGMDEQGLGKGPDLGGVDMPTIVQNYAGQQEIIGSWNWTNIACSSGPAAIGAAGTAMKFSPGPQILLVTNQNYRDNQSLTNYNSHVYPHELVAAAGVSEWQSSPAPPGSSTTAVIRNATIRNWKTGP